MRHTCYPYALRNLFVMNNAILIRFADIIPIEVDFSDLNNIYSAIGAEGVSTIHTATTQDISRKLGVHLMGFVDRDGDDINNDVACKISGYDYLGSSMLLCKTDNSFHALPFNGAELNCVYTYLTTGKVIPSVATDGDFFEIYGINPVLPNFGVQPRIVLSPNYPTLALVVFDLRSVDMAKVGENLFYYADTLVKRFGISFGFKLSPDGKYYTINKWVHGYAYFVVCIEVADGQPVALPIIDSILDELQADIVG